MIFYLPQEEATVKARDELGCCRLNEVLTKSEC